MEHAPFHADQAEGPDGKAAYWLTAADGRRLRIAVWPKPDAKGTVLLFPGRTEYVEKYGRAAADLAARGYATVAIDWRGQGLSDRVHDDVSMGHVDSFSDYQLDVQAAFLAVRELALPEPFFLIAHSMGGAIGLRALQNGLPVNAAAFSAPMWGILMNGLPDWAKTFLSWALTTIGWGSKRAPGTAGETYVLREPFEGNLLTSDPDMYAYMVRHAHHDTGLHLGGPSMDWVHKALVECHALMKMPAPNVPTKVFLGTKEAIVDPVPIKRYMPKWPNGELIMVEGARHEIMMEGPKERGLFFDEVDALFSAHL